MAHTTNTTKVTVWQERDRLHIALLDKDTEATIIEWWDEAALDAVDDILDASEARLGNLARHVQQGGALHKSIVDFWNSRN